LDNINLYSGPPSNDLVLATINENLFDNLNIYPNPTDGDLHLTFNSSIGGASMLYITDITGKRVKSYPLQIQTGSNVVITETTGLASGTYLIQLHSNGFVTTRSFIVE